MKIGDHLLGLGPELVEARRHHLKLGRADVGAMGEAEEDQHIAAAEILVGHRLAGLIDEGEGAADQRLAGGRTLGPCAPCVRTSSGRAAERADQKAGDDHGQERPRIYSPNCTSVPFSRALPGTS